MLTTRGMKSRANHGAWFMMVSCLFLAGCSKPTYELPNTVEVSGRLTNDGEILTVEGRENGTGMIVVGFHPIVDGKPIERVSSAAVNEQGVFKVLDGLEPGEYLITIRQWQPYDSNDLLKGKFGPRKSPIRRTISGDTELQLDLANLQE